MVSLLLLISVGLKILASTGLFISTDFTFIARIEIFGMQAVDRLGQDACGGRLAAAAPAREDKSVREPIGSKCIAQCV